MKRLMSLALIGVLGGGVVLLAQSETESDGPVYEREVFNYERGGRVDPFRSLLTSQDLGVRIEDLVLVGIVYNPAAGQSLAVFLDVAGDRRYRLVEGQRVDGITVVNIHPRYVDVRVEEFDVSRVQRLFVREMTEEEQAQERAPAAASSSSETPNRDDR